MKTKAEVVTGQELPDHTNWDWCFQAFGEFHACAFEDRPQASKSNSPRPRP
jgi:hypothetical protein